MSWQVILSTLLFYLLPLSVGRAIYLIFDRKNKTVLNFPLYFALGTLLIFFSRFLLNKFYFEFIYVLFALSFIINLIFIKRLKKYLTWQFLALILLATLTSLVAYLIWIYKSPFNLNWDLYEHQTLVNLILGGKFSFFTTQISDTFGFNSYPPVFHILLSTSQFFFDRSPEFIMNYWQVLSFWHLLLISIASFCFAFSILKNKWLASISLLIGSMTFESSVAFTNFFILPQTTTALIFAFSYALILLNKKLKIWPILLLTIYLILSHYVVGFLAALVILASYFYESQNQILEKLSYKLPLAESFIILAILGILSSQVLNLEFINSGEAALYNFSLSDKLFFLQRSYAYLFYFFLPLGLFFSYKNHSKKINLSLLLLFGFLAILISNFPYVLKFYTLARFFVSFFLAAGFLAILEKIKSNFFKVLSTLLLIGSLIVILILNSFAWKKELLSDDLYTHINGDYLKAAEFLKANYSGNDLLISDPATQYVLEALSLVNSVEGVFADKDFRDNFYIYLNSRQASNLDKIEDKLERSLDKKLLVLSSKTIDWYRSSEVNRSSFNFNVWPSRKITPTDFDFIEKFNLKELYKNNTIYIFQID